jgi:predicted PurR-regulated permease PerM
VSRNIVASVVGLVLNLGLMVLVLFFMLRDYDALSAFFRDAVPLARTQEDILISETAAVTRSVLVGNAATAVLQGIAGGFAMWLCGFPGFFWGAMISLASFIPVIGTALIWVPAAAYLMLTGELNWGIFLVVWSAVIVGSIDNFIRPMFMAGATDINGLVIFLSILGGLQVFGLLGLLYGPLIVSLALVLYSMYRQEFSEFIEHQDGR